MNIETLQAVYFIGAGGIGMSVLVRYFLSLGKTVAGYDRTPSDLTARLQAEGAQLHYEDNPDLIPEACRNRDNTLVVYTPAIPQTHREWQYFRERGFEIHKRAQVLGFITRSKLGLCVAGTHGKTTTSTMLAHILYRSHVGCTAFLGGISQNYATNLLLSSKCDYVVIEADEFDRSFHWLSPYMAVITSADADHLDIYGTEAAYLESFRHFTTLIHPEGCLVIHEGIKVKPDVPAGVRVYTYAREHGDFHAERIRIGEGRIVFDLVTPGGRVPDVELGVPVSINIENGIAAAAIARLCGATDDELRDGLVTFKGVERRFDFRFKTADRALLTDYAHHPAEIRQSALSLRELYRGCRLTALFQPHLYTRTRDFYKEFAESLSLFDEVILTEIYPARERPLPGVSSRLIYDRLAPQVTKTLCRRADVLDVIRRRRPEILVVLGAGDLDCLVPSINEILQPS